MLEAECVVCLQLYDEGEHLPRVLSCGHSLCDACTSDLPSQWAGTTSSSSSSSVHSDAGGCGGGLIRCPECKQQTRMPLGGHSELPKNIELMRLVQSVQNSDPQEQRILKKRQIDHRAVNRKHRGEEGEKDSETAGNKFWIIPRSTVKLRGETVDALLVADLCIDGRAWRKKTYEEVTLHLLSTATVTAGDGSSYKQSVKAAWNQLQADTRFELLKLQHISHQCEHVLEILGLWMSEEGNLFLVSKDHVQGWKKAQALLERKKHDDDDGECSFKGDAVGSQSTSSDSCHKMEKETAAGVSSAGTLCRLAVELCETLIEVHAHGLILGVLGAECLILDEFDHLQLHLIRALLLKQQICNSINSRVSVPESLNSLALEPGIESSPEEETGNKSSESTVGFLCWNHEYMSPEVLRCLEKVHSREEGIESSGSTGVVASDDTKFKHVITYKADSWSLGFLLLRLFSSRVVVNGVHFSEVIQSILEGRCLHLTWLEDRLPLLGQHGQLREQLSKCFAPEPSERPEVDEIWRGLKMLIDDQPLFSPAHQKGNYQESLWVFGLSAFSGDDSNLLDGSLEFEEQTGTEATIDLIEDDHSHAAEVGQETLTISRALIDSEICGNEVQNLQGHLDVVSALALCGDYLISASFDKTLRIWSLKDDRLMQVLEGHGRRITAVAVHEASNVCVSGDYGGQICVWNLSMTRSSSAPVATWQEHDDWRYSGVASLVVSSDQVLYSGSGDTTIKAWSLVDFQFVTDMQGHKGVVSTLLVEGQVLYSGSWDGTIRLWWRPNHSILAHLGGPSSQYLGGVRTLARSSDSGLLFAARDSGSIQVWRDGHEEYVRSIEQAHKGVIASVVFDGGWLYSGSWDSSIKAWPIEEVLSADAFSHVQRTCGATITALACTHEKLYAGVAHTIQVYSCNNSPIIPKQQS